MARDQIPSKYNFESPVSMQIWEETLNIHPTAIAGDH